MINHLQLTNIIERYHLHFPIYGGGVGWVGAPRMLMSVAGMRIMKMEKRADKNVPSAGVIAHELGHNFNMHHSNTYLSLSEHPNSDEVLKHEYTTRIR